MCCVSNTSCGRLRGVSVGSGEAQSFSVEAYFIENMKAERERRGWSQGELAKRLRSAGLDQMHQTTVSRMEKGERPVRVDEANAIAGLFGVALVEMLAAPGKLSTAANVIRCSQLAHDAAKELEWAVTNLRMQAAEFDRALGLAYDAMNDTNAGTGQDAPGVIALSVRLAFEHLGAVQGETWRSLLLPEFRHLVHSANNPTNYPVKASDTPEGRALSNAMKKAARAEPSGQISTEAKMRGA